MKLIIFAGPPTCGKTSIIKHLIKRMKDNNSKPAFLKIDVRYADEDQQIRKEFKIPVKKVYSDELCPDHCTVLVLDEAIKWAKKQRADILFVETAGLCLRCSPYVSNSLGVVVLEATSGMSLPRKIGPMLSLADVAVVTKIDLVSQAEREVFRARILDATKGVRVIETNALYGIGIEQLAKKIEKSPKIKEPIRLKGDPPVGTCTICVGKRDVGWGHHYGVLRTLNSDLDFRGE
jgi:Ni2+-binding GTPase involved in maturation of urease and hydrogenase